MSLRIWQVDAFSDKPFAGNPAAVCVLAQAASAEWMQKVAMEMNLSETAFTWNEGAAWRLRWFTPVEEVDLCGHATLATAHTLWEQGFLPPTKEAVFITRSGELRTRREEFGMIAMDFPAIPSEPIETPANLAEALGVPAVAAYRNQHDYLVEVATEDEVHRLQPNMTLLAAATTRGVIVTSRTIDPQIDFVSRFFAPAVGIPEDPVTGSAHCALGPFWSARIGKSAMTGYQASRRGGLVGVEIMSGGRVMLRGKAVTVMAGELLGDPA
jgi:PhzF family phenazine biosynthesis protein